MGAQHVEWFVCRAHLQQELNICHFQRGPVLLANRIQLKEAHETPHVGTLAEKALVRRVVPQQVQQHRQTIADDHTSFASAFAGQDFE